MYTCTHSHTYIYIYIYIHTHTHTHTQMDRYTFMLRDTTVGNEYDDPTLNPCKAFFIFHHGNSIRNGVNPPTLHLKMGK